MATDSEVTCGRCGMEIRQDHHGDWIDPETHTTCPDTKRKHQPAIVMLVVDAALGAAGVEDRETIMFETCEAMMRHGGSFAQALGAAARAADPQNRARLVSAFPDFFGRYAMLSQAGKRRRR